MRSVFPSARSVTVACVQLEHLLSRAWMPALELVLSRVVQCPPVFKLTMSTGVMAQLCPEVHFRECNFSNTLGTPELQCRLSSGLTYLQSDKLIIVIFIL